LVDPEALHSGPVVAEEGAIVEQGQRPIAEKTRIVLAAEG
jgi:hypothetical protein